MLYADGNNLLISPLMLLKLSKKETTNEEMFT